jgi:broad specificity phosphatase PhoE
VGKVIAGWKPGYLLNDIGRAHAETLAQHLARLPIRAVYTSPLERAVETAEIIAKAVSLAPQVREDLGEMRLGEWEGQPIAKLEQDLQWMDFNELRSQTRPPGGELMIETQARMVRQLEALRSEHVHEMIAVVSHGDPLRGAVCHYLGIAIDMMLRFEIFPGSVTVMEVGAMGPRVLCVNETGKVPL